MSSRSHELEEFLTGFPNSECLNRDDDDWLIIGLDLVKI